MDQLDLTLNPMEYMVKLFPEERVDPLRAHCGRLGLRWRFDSEKSLQ